MSIQIPGEHDVVPTGARPPETPSERAELALAVEEYRTLLEAAEQQLDDVDRALAALDEGTYGACEVCGVAIDDRDLAADPLVSRCATHREAEG